MDERIRLDTALIKRALVASRQEAQECIEKGAVFVNGIIVKKVHYKISPEDILTVTGRRKYVSRGGEKLEGALLEVYKNKDTITLHIQGKSALDIGSSTGGFTDCLLSFGIDHVDAVDVGTSQLHVSLHNNIHVTVFEHTDIRTFKPANKYDILVADLSFISLHKVLETVFSFTKPGTELFLLVKPQFEVGKEYIKKGIVKDGAKQKEVVENICTKISGLYSCRVMWFPCVLKGGDGNQEYFIYVVCI